MNLFKVPDRWEEMTEDEQLAWSGRVLQETLVSHTRRLYLGDRQTAPELRNRWVEVLFRFKGPGPRNALVRFDDGDERIVPTYAGGGIGATR